MERQERSQCSSPVGKWWRPTLSSERVGQTQHEGLLELEIAKSAVIVLLVTVVVKSPSSVEVGLDILVEAEGEIVLPLRLDIFV